MSQENVEIVRGIIEAARRGDWETAIGEYDPDVILDQTRMPGGASTADIGEFESSTAGGFGRGMTFTSGWSG
jgi:hypothetical protein